MVDFFQKLRDDENEAAARERLQAKFIVWEYLKQIVSMVCFTIVVVTILFVACHK